MNGYGDNARSTRIVRAVCVVVALGLWFWTQALIGRRDLPDQGISDGLHQLLIPLHAQLEESPALADALLIASSLGIDLFGLFLLSAGIMGSSIRPFLGLVLLFSLRQLCQALTALPLPDGMIWRDPGFPSLLVTYSVANDLFFSGHTAIAVYGAIELAWTRSIGLAWVAGFMAVFEAVTVLALRAHYTMDVFTGAAVAGLVAIVAAWIAPQCDEWLIRFARRFPQI